MSADDCATITWAINNYSRYWQKFDEAVVSPVFSIYMPEETKWRLMWFPSGVIFFLDCVSFYLHRDKDCNGADNIKVECSLDCLRSDGSYRDVPFTKEFRKNERQGYSIFLCTIRKESKNLQQDILTLRCRLFRFNGKAVEKTKIFVRTVFGVNKLLSQLLIRNFNSLEPDQTQSFVIKSESKDLTKGIKLAVTDENKENICFDIDCIDRDMKSFSVKIFIIDSQKRKIDFANYECWSDSGISSMFPLKIPKKELIENKSRYLPNDVLTLSFEFTISTGLSFEDKEKSPCEYDSHPLPDEVTESLRKCVCISHKNLNDCPCALITDLTSLHEDQSTCDVKLKTRANTFPVHTAILSARSPVFKAMFSNDMKEKTNGCVDMSDLQDETVRRFLLYLYTDQLEDLTWDDALHLFKAADKYAVISLKDKCSSFLKSNLNLENACEALMLSDLHQDKNLKESTQNFILRNGKVIFKSEEWKCLVDNNPKLASEAMLRNWNEE
ncbi:unnamed protein product [Larinioides sclopetarius]|uniref:Speckle-type POZ protein n=1 Tax=Larinioides sclopetarius TaxID=280406 RepID=A0AAV2AXS4_9ARAC